MERAKSFFGSSTESSQILRSLSLANLRSPFHFLERYIIIKVSYSLFRAPAKKNIFLKKTHLPTTCIKVLAVAVENDGASAVTSHEKFPDKPNPTCFITTKLAFDRESY